jgi:uncharacterized protein YidB (DUF937 family)
MGLLDGLLSGMMGGGAQGALGGGGLQGAMGGGAQAALLQAVVGMLGNGGLHSMVSSFEQKGLGSLVGSWIGSGQNIQPSPAQITHGLGADQLQKLAQASGLDVSQVAGHLSNLLPGLVDRLTPQGSLPSASSLDGVLKGALGGLLGG